MKTLKNFLRFVVCIGLLAASTTVFGQFQIVNLDENGNGYITQSLPFAYGVAVEPISGVRTLWYQLPYAGVAGDVLLQESVGGPLSDLLRFDGNGHVWFFSDSENGTDFDALADVLQIPQPVGNIAGPFLEQGPEGNNGYLYLPNSGQPGSQPAVPVAYNIISDVPEPGSALLALLGGSFLVLKSRRAGRN